VELNTAQGPVLHVKGADLMDGTPIYDIKPYIAYADAHPQARCGFVDSNEWKTLEVNICPAVARLLNEKQREALEKTLALDPRPHFHNDPTKVYGMKFDGMDIHFTVDGKILNVIEL
jgi:hypothetical protein